MTKMTRMTKMRYRLPGIYRRRGVARSGRIRGAGDKLKLCSFAFTPCGSVWCGSPSTIPTTLLLWSNDILRVDSSTVGPSPVSARSLENLKNVKGVTWSHGPPMERPCLEMGAKNHSTVNLRLLLKRSWNRLSYSRSMRLSGTPRTTTNVL